MIYKGRQSLSRSQTENQIYFASPPMPPPTKSNIAFLVMVASVVGGGVFPHILSRFRPLAPPPWPWSSMKLGVGAWYDDPVALPPLSSPAAFSLLSHPQSHPQIYISIPALWSLVRYSPLCCSPVKLFGSVGCLQEAQKVDSWLVFWSGWDLEVKRFKTKAFPTRSVGGLGFSPELVPVVYCFTGVGSSFVVLSMIWATGVGSGWFVSLLYGSTVLLFGLSRSHILATDERYGRSMDMGLSPTSKGVCSFAPYGAIKLLTVLVSGPSNGSANLIPLRRTNYSCWAPIHKGFIVILYGLFVSVVVFLTLTIVRIFVMLTC